MRKALEISPDLKAADENLGKLTLTSNRTARESFWDFWTSSRSKKLIALIIGLSIAVVIILYGWNINFGKDSTTTEIITNGIKNTTTTVEGPSDIPETYLIVIAIMLFIILLPEIKKKPKWVQ